jgi:hypothetical protein
MANTKLDLKLLHRLVKELELQLKVAYQTRDEIQSMDDIDTYHQFSIDADKAAGLLYGITQESAALISDLKKIVLTSISGSENSDLATQLLASLVPSKKSNGTC